MTDWKTRLTEKLEPVLRSSGPAPADQRLPRHAVRHLPLPAGGRVRGAPGGRPAAHAARAGGQAGHDDLARRVPARALEAKGLEHRRPRRRRESPSGSTTTIETDPPGAQRVRAARRPRRRSASPATPTRSVTSSSSCGPARSSRSTGPRRCSSSSRARSTFPPCSSTRASSTAPRASASWASSTPSTTTDRRSSERGARHDDPTIIKDLFASDIDRNIEEVIKVDQTDEQIIRDELAEYVATDSIRAHFRDDPRALRARRRTSRTKASASGSPASSAPASRASPSTSGSRSRTARSLGEGAADLLAQRIGRRRDAGAPQEHRRSTSRPMR